MLFLSSVFDINKYSNSFHEVGQKWKQVKTYVVAGRTGVVDVDSVSAL